MKRRIIILPLLLLLVAPLLADSQSLVSEPGLVELRIDKPDGAEVSLSWEPRDPVDLQYRTYEGSTVMVFYGEPGKRIVVMSELIHWDARRVEKTTWIVTVRGNEPDPDPPGPDPPKPDPPAPVPPDVPNALGVGAPVYQAAKDVNQPAQVGALADAFLAVEQQLHQGSVIAADALKALQIPPVFSSLEPVIFSAVNTAAEKYGRGQTAMKSYFHEMRLAVEGLKP